MLLKILVVGVVLIGAMAAIRNGSVLRKAGLLSTCNPVNVSGHAGENTLSCSKGRLDGFPDMSDKSCNLIAVSANRQLWSCDAPVVSSQTPTG